MTVTYDAELADMTVERLMLALIDAPPPATTTEVASTFHAVGLLVAAMIAGAGLPNTVAAMLVATGVADGTRRIKEGDAAMMAFARMKPEGTA